MKIYTKNGDQGKTQLVDGKSISKSHPRLESYGTVDELNSSLGICLELLPAKKKWILPVQKSLLRIQHELFNLGSLLACEDQKFWEHLPRLEEKNIQQLEIEIDQMLEKLPPLKNFILPGGSLLASHLHLARTICRRAERKVAPLMETQNQYATALKYLNRLSDFLFVLSRYSNLMQKKNDQIWLKS